MDKQPAWKNRYSVGLTGGIGSGKSTVARLFAAAGAAVIDTDLISHRLTAANGAAIAQIKASFGARFILPDGAMDRSRMRAAVFAEPDAKARLEAILHPMIRQQTELAAQQAQGAYLIFVVPLLVESGVWQQRVSRILVVDCSEQTQIERVMQRNALSKAEVQTIIANQATRAERLAIADDIVTNDSDHAQLEQQVNNLHRTYLACAQSY
jgi:dephospho-CoA kinase